MEYANSAFSSVREEVLTVSQTIQFYSSQFSMACGLLYMVFSQLPGGFTWGNYFGGFALYTGAVSAVIASLGGAFVAPRWGANWPKTKKTLTITCLVACLVSVAAAVIQFSLAVVTITSTTPVSLINAIGSELAGSYPMQGYIGLVCAVSLFGICVTAAVSLFSDVLSARQLVKMIQDM